MERVNMEPWSTLGHWVQPRGPEKVVKERLTTELGLKGRPVRLVRTGHSDRDGGLVDEENGADR